MKVIGINGSARKDSNTAIIIGRVFDELKKYGIETELIQLSDYEIQPCRGALPVKDAVIACLRMMDLPKFSVI